MNDLNPFAVGYENAEPSIIEHGEIAILNGPASSGKTVQHMPSADYHADPAPDPSLSATLAKLLLTKSPLHAWHASPRLNPNRVQVNRKTFDIGRAAHRAVLGAGDDFVAIPEEMLGANGAVSTKEAKAFIADCRASDRVPLKQGECDQVEAMAAVAAYRLGERGVALDPQRSELAAFAQIDGIWCRAMFDNVPADPSLPIYDFKTCEDSSPDACLRAVLKYSYDVQAVHYQAVWKAATGEDRAFVFIFQEKPVPHEVTLIRLTGSFEELAKRRAAKARKLWADCISTNNWPGYAAGLHEIDPPMWLIERELQEECA